VRDDRADYSIMDGHEVRYESKKTGRSAAKKVGSSRKRVEKRLWS